MPNVEEIKTEATPTIIPEIKETITKEPEQKKKGRPKKETKETKAPVKRRKTRSYQELVQAAVKGMTDKEKENLIAALKDEISVNLLKIESLKNNCESAYAQARELEKQYEAMEQHYRTKLQYIDEQTNAFLKAIRLATRGGLN